MDDGKIGKAKIIAIVIFKVYIFIGLLLGLSFPEITSS